MDVFSQTLPPTAVVAGVSATRAGRHLANLRRCMESGDDAVLVTRCTRVDRPAQGDYLLLLTHRRLVVMRRTRLLRRLRLHLNAELRHLTNVTWNSDPNLSAVELAATAIDGVRERFLIQVGDPKRVWQLDAVLNHRFRPGGASRVAPALAT